MEEMHVLRRHSVIYFHRLQHMNDIRFNREIERILPIRLEL